MSAAGVYFKGYVTVLACAGLFALLAVPLILRKIPRNVVYGYRTRRTLENDRVWYEANAFFGWCVIAASALSTVAIQILYSSMTLAPNHYMTASILVQVVPLVIAVALTRRRISTITGGP